MTSVCWPCHRIAVQGVEPRTGLPGIEPQAGVAMWPWTGLLNLCLIFLPCRNGDINRTYSPDVKGNRVHVGGGLVITITVFFTFARGFL